MKKNFRKIPPKIQAKLGTINTDYVEVGTTERFTHQQILSGALSHLGVTIGPDGLPNLPISTMPSMTNGRTSKVNFEGKEVKRTDLPKVTKIYSMEVPSWGSSSTTHTVHIPRLVYERDFIPPAMYKIEIELLRTEPGDTIAYMIKFKLDTPLQKDDIDFESDLLFALNLIQENVGSSDVLRFNASDDEYLATQYLAWEIFPPGEKDQVFNQFVRGKRKPNSTSQARIEERYRFLMEFNPECFIKGSNGFRNYFGAKFDKDVVVFENIDYGNAIYVIQDKWEDLSKLSRLELMKKYRGQFVRIVHGNGWKEKLRQTIHELTQ